MAIRINTNIDAINAQRNLGVNSASYSKTISKLSSGLRITQAADDAAGLSISEKLRAQLKGMNMAQRSSQDGVSMIQTAEGALGEIHSMLQRMRELAVQAGNSTLSSSDHAAVAGELVQLRDEINGIAARTKFNGQGLLNGDLVTSLDAASEVEVGTAIGATTMAMVTAVDVSGAKGNSSYVFTNSGGNLLVTEYTAGVATGNTQTLTVGAAATNNVHDMAAGETQTIDINSLGVKLTVIANATTTGTNIHDTLVTAATDSVTTNAGSGSATVKIGAGNTADDKISVAFSAMTSADIGSGGTSLSTGVNTYNTTRNTANADSLLGVIDEAIDDVSTQRATLGAKQNRLEHTLANLEVSSENLAASQSRIRDVDMAAEIVNFVRGQILNNAGTSVLAQANQAPQSVLSLLR